MNPAAAQDNRLVWLLCRTSYFLPHCALDCETLCPVLHRLVRCSLCAEHQVGLVLVTFTRCVESLTVTHIDMAVAYGLGKRAFLQLPDRSLSTCVQDLILRVCPIQAATDDGNSKQVLSPAMATRRKKPLV